MRISQFTLRVSRWSLHCELPPTNHHQIDLTAITTRRIEPCKFAGYMRVTSSFLKLFYQPAVSWPPLMILAILMIFLFWLKNSLTAYKTQKSFRKCFFMARRRQILAEASSVKVFKRTFFLCMLFDLLTVGTWQELGRKFLVESF